MRWFWDFTETFRHLRKDRPNDFTAPKNTSTVRLTSMNRDELG